MKINTLYDTQLAAQRLSEFESQHEQITAASEIIRTIGYLFARSEFIFQTCLKYPQVCSELSEHLAHGKSVDIHFPTELLAEPDEKTFQKHLRVFRHKTMVLIAADDFLALTSIKESMLLLSKLADELYVVSRTWSIESLKPRFGQALNKEHDEIALIALGMGKLGGYELNFSSDIDLIFCYSEKGQTQGGRKSEDFQIYFTKLAQKIIQLLDEVTGDGQVFRVDMRLRPFGESGPLVSSFDAIEDYYQNQGREWERYALLKARPLGQVGSISNIESSQHQVLVKVLKPFVFRRYIDFSVIESLRTMKKQIQNEVKRRRIVLNIKLGSGGIREIEFIVQAMQMLRGGKEPQLQQASLLKTLPELVTLNVFSGAEGKALAEDYLWLRQCEQYLQAFGDQQTQTLPTEPELQTRLIELFGFTDWQSFLNHLAEINKRVSQMFISVVGEPEQAEDKSNDAKLAKWNDVWEQDEKPAVMDDFDHAEVVWKQKSDLIKQVSGARGRERLDQLMPQLLMECAEQKVGKVEFTEILVLLKKIASRTAYLELLVENAGALSQLIKLTSSCQFIGQQISRFPLLLDQLIDPKQLYKIPDLTNYNDDLRRQLLRVEPDDLEMQMEVLRQFKLTNQLVIAACDVTGVASLMQVSDHLTEIAEACLEQATGIAWQQMIKRFGYPDGATDDHKNFAIIGYGKLGGFELGYGSDLDIVFIHGCQSSKETDGKKAIDSRQFYLKLAQRLLHLFTTRTMSGELYEVDTRLRPSGASGLLAINIETFYEYQTTEAWTWEHQALVRSRIVAGDDILAKRFDQIRLSILSTSRENDVLTKQIAEMRTKMHDNLSKETEELFDLKQSRGGIADIEFISQYLVLQFAEKHPELTKYSDNIRILNCALELKLIEQTDFDSLTQAYIEFREHYHKASLNNAKKLLSVKALPTHIGQVRKTWTRLLG
ncbi:bifunctional [glutamate--ammonia ligase]-adenylyl-L-tyrosine phosphorylase/[glutamate--ammonia-ligase] adenylyltransferase [Psychrosphaera sp. 1_MG-2023]|uniref:bifunctional [glutamate--ammonia ligase]-adenylyl-L-tyrosine phosphorylase/[glutamate--ammonia-ligase] adenylyltransferase n=1 Tax=Psychrosphaera sp. 1_MG-2023 TaxID=3062643 RepID=UPI0026E15C97|nr:bifunctional [glutamate--ammonia ligase]-adenylyl-L-tyrosine phosphorylase/[glutamate--ammonia-ligase] adenylyltransferase [Psychrosphaera sp. 1_MG-2023]MDO6719246.1 bifunctional [glutamate--ammonia ligase]-adenylyl-L-tyrosine phosphorylase/[glutamate--ammonia-ligase] adenylyltransferase [Psychrosphaera sp. 1_MG-2023]